MQCPNGGFEFDANFNFGTQTPLVLEENISSFPGADFFMLLNGTYFLLLDGSNFALLGN